jgi:hypothetical protein
MVWRHGLAVPALLRCGYRLSAPMMAASTGSVSADR